MKRLEILTNRRYTLQYSGSISNLSPTSRDVYLQAFGTLLGAAAVMYREFPVVATNCGLQFKMQIKTLGHSQL